MVVGAFPAAKLGTLLLKQISKPIANAVKSQAKSSPVFRKYVCMPPAQFYNWCEIKAKMWILNLGKPVNIPVLNEAMAIELGANLLGEGIIFIIAAGILISEYNRSANKEAVKEESKKQEIIDLQNTIRELFIQTEEQSAQLRELTRKLGSIEIKFGIPNPVSSSKSTPKLSPPSSGSSDEKVVNKDKNYKEVYVVPTTPSAIYQPAVNVSVEPTNCTKNSMTKDTKYSSSVILRAVDNVEEQFWGYPFVVENQEDNILFLSLYHVQTLLRFKD